VRELFSTSKNNIDFYPSLDCRFSGVYNLELRRKDDRAADKKLKTDRVITRRQHYINTSFILNPLLDFYGEKIGDFTHR
jgi:hypothetical protein